MAAKERRRIIALQRSSGLTYLSDPLLTSDDMLRPFCRLEGVKPGPLDRFFENNMFYRKPVVVGRVTGGGEILRDLVGPINEEERGKLKVSLPDPYTLASLSENRYYADGRQLVRDYAEVLRMEIRTLAKEGVAMVELNAPSTARIRDEAAIANALEAFKCATDGAGVKAILNFYFADASPIVGKVLEWGIHGIGIDFLETQLFSLKGNGFDGILCAGIMDARSTLMESPKKLADLTMHIMNELHPEQLYIRPNCDLEFLPYQYANRKVKNLGRALSLLRR